MSADKGIVPSPALGRDAGFSLLEVLVAFAVTGLVLAALLPSLQMARARAQHALDRRQAAVFAQSQLEALKLLPLDTEAGQSGYSAPWVWRASFTIHPAPSTTLTRLRTVRLEVSREAADAPLLAVETKQLLAAPEE